MARMHEAAADFPMSRENTLGQKSWRALFAPSAPRANEVKAGIAELVQGELDALERDWPPRLPCEIVHADLFPDNVFFIGSALSGFIDFYFACTDFLAYDLAVALNAWCFEPDGMFNVTKARAFFAGYEGVRRLSADERAAMPILARGAALRFLLTRLHDWLHHDASAFVTPKDPLEYVGKLRFHRAAGGPAALGLG